MKHQEAVMFGRSLFADESKVTCLSVPIRKTARISPCGTYRWTLTRGWGDGKKICWVMLNPSTADHRVDDPTIKRVIHFTRSWGGDGFTAVNLYPFRSPDPAECRRWANWESNGPDWQARDALQRNIAIVARESKRAARVVAAWGSIAWDSHWIDHVIAEITGVEEPGPAIYCLGTTESGAPKHPLARGQHRVRDDQRPVLWRAGS
jgi:hypothetical protein